VIIKLLLPLGLAFIMFAIGLTLEFKDFIRVFHQPRTMLLGLFCQIILLPVLAFLLLISWDIDPLLSIGVMILAASPGGITSNLLTHFARGDSALSISLTAISSVIGMFTVPLIVAFAIFYFSDRTQLDNIPVWRMSLGVFIVATLPVLIGMAVNYFKPKAAHRIEAVARPLSVLIFFGIISATFISQWDPMMDNISTIGPIMLILNIAILTIGYYAAILIGTGQAAAKAISLEGGLQNGAIGIFVATSLLGNATMAIPSITYALIMNLSAAVFILLAQRALHSKEASTSD
jgi:BASS family bile acid:Na+ symporter